MSTIGLVADVHMRDAHAAVVERGLEAVVDALAAEEPAHVFVLGDLIEDGDTTAEDRRNLGRVVDAFEGLDAPVTYLLGNHDVARLDRSTLGAVLEQEAFYGVVEAGGTPFVYLDSTAGCAEPPAGALGVDQRAWLAETVRGLEGAVVLVHHPMGGFDLSENAWFADVPERAFLGDRLQAFGAIDGANVVGTVSGHLHATQFARFMGLPHVSVSAFSKELPDRPFTGTYALLELDEQVGVEVRTPAGVQASFALE